MSVAALLPMPAGQSALELRIAGRAVIDRTVAAILAMHGVGRVVVAPQHPPGEGLRALLLSVAPGVRVSEAHRGRLAALRRALLVAGPVDRVLVHDADMPLMATAELEALVGLLDESPCAVLSVPVKSTIKVARDGVIEDTLPRDRLCYVTGPRAFRREALERALVEQGELDEVSAARRAGLPVAVRHTSAASCMRVTGAEDVDVAERLLTVVPVGSLP